MNEIQLSPQVVEQIVVNGDLGRLSSQERLAYIAKTCERVGLDPLAKPFELLRLNGRVVLYATKSCTDQLRALHKISVSEPTTELVGDIYTAKVTATNAEGRSDSDMGSVCIANLSGEKLSNALMKAVTKAKRRVTLSMCGLGMLDDSEIESVPGAKRVVEEDLSNDREDRKQALGEDVPVHFLRELDALEEKLEVALSEVRVLSVEPAATTTNGKSYSWFVIKIDHKYGEMTTFSDSVASVCNDAEVINALAVVAVKKNGDKILNLKYAEPAVAGAESS